MSFFCASQLYVMAGNAQNSVIVLPSKQVTIGTLFSEIESQTDYLVVYSNREMDVDAKVDLSHKRGKVKDVLDELSEETGMKYEYTNNYIVFSKAGTTVPRQEQAKVKVTGKIYDAKTKEPIIGATVVEKGTTNATVSDMNGNFTVNVTSSTSKLDISYVGYVTQRQSVKAGGVMYVALSEDTQALDEVVVVGYAVQKKVNLSGAVSTVSTKQLENRPVTNVGQALQGTVANLNVTIGSGQATDSPSFNIRGTTSLNGGEPLIVIDGVISSAWVLNNMTPTDIASISVLKDAASSAIYGSRAAYGVILVTTKSGASEKLTVSYSNNFSMRSNTKMPDIISDPYTVATWRNTMSYPWYNLYNEEQLAYAK